MTESNSVSTMEATTAAPVGAPACPACGDAATRLYEPQHWDVLTGRPPAYAAQGRLTVGPCCETCAQLARREYLESRAAEQAASRDETRLDVARRLLAEAAVTR